MLRQLGTRVSPCGQLGPRALLALSTCSRAAEAASCPCSISITTSQAAVGASGAGASSQEATSQVWAARVLDSATASAYSAWPLHQQHGCQSSLSHQPSLLSGPAQHSGRWRSQSGWQAHHGTHNGGSALLQNRTLVRHMSTQQEEDKPKEKPAYERMRPRKPFMPGALPQHPQHPTAQSDSQEASQQQPSSAEQPQHTSPWFAGRVKDGHGWKRLDEISDPQFKEWVKELKKERGIEGKDSTVYLFRVNAPLALLCIVFLSGTFVYKIITWFAE